LAASRTYRVPVVGGDLSAGDELVISVAVLGRSSAPVLRSGARPGDHLFVTGPLGRSAAGLRELRADPSATGACAAAHRRPAARLSEGDAARRGGATAMIDLSDGLGIDLDRLASASGVGVDLTALPVATGATAEEALAGGEDYELVFSAPSREAVMAEFSGAGLAVPIHLGRVVADREMRRLAGVAFDAVGHEHALG